jgi:Kef-type K+ transport system membrane component KefB
MQTLLIIAIAMAAGLLLSRLMKILNLPNVTGYLIAGVLIGPYVFKLVSTEQIKELKLVTSTALGFIAFSIGGEFKLQFLKKLGKQIIIITVAQAAATVLLVIIALRFIPGEHSLPRALLLGAIAAATAPAATLLVVRQYKARGPVTDTLLPVTAFDDAIGLMIFSVCLALAIAFSSGKGITASSVLLEPLREIALSLLTGGIMGALLALSMRFFRSNANRLSLMLAAVFACVALSEKWELSSLLTCMMLGCVFANMRRDSVRVLEIVDGWTPAIFMLFFVFSGAELDFSILTTVGLIGVVYLIARSTGKYFGSYVGAAMSKSDKNVKKYLGITLFPQAGVAIGMAQMVAASPELPAELASQVVTVALFATLVYELIGPLLTKMALKKAGEIAEANLGRHKPLANIARLFKRSAPMK